MTSLTMLTGLRGRDAGNAIHVDGHALSYTSLAQASAGMAAALGPRRRVALWAEPSLETIVSVVAAIRAGVTIVPINPKAGQLELSHIVSDSAPEAVVAGASTGLPTEFAQLTRIDARTDLRADWIDPDVAPTTPAIIFYTSGTTDTPKGVPLSRANVAANLDALAGVWDWTGADRLTHALPLFHVHGLVLGVLGPLRLGGEIDYVAHFTPAGIHAALGRGATMVFGVPTMYHRIADAAESDPSFARALAGARLLVSGSAGLPPALHERMERVCGQRVVERYGMTETLMITAIRARGERAAGYVGQPLPGVEVRLVDDHGAVVSVEDDETIAEVTVRGPSVFEGYLNREQTTAEVVRAGWFYTGDLATRSPNGYLRIVGRRSTDIIKSGGYKIGALEIESVLLSHEAVAEAAVAGVDDDDLGERVTAWVVLRDGYDASPGDLQVLVRARLAGHKRPRVIHLVPSLPRNAMGKVLKRELVEP